ncbi:GntR family transcriptional regulator [Actinomadura soli]|uniref:GntR family transcriptional regulator n=1 Tax=Actinomadura soli TaxID=2508997 RepID=A0A5C4JHW0_9ACTN|nr:GntR family transcriptional regulator [Actinomadura soli]TMR05704.1 GntR family transcriptional regulator [Actinomadura soli]
MPRNTQGPTLVNNVYGAVKDDICMGRLRPGQRLHLGEICKAQGVSLSVVREAVTRLAAERLVKSRPQQGFSVWPLSVDDLVDLTRVRIEIETLALRESIAKGDLAWESEVVAAHHRLEGTVRPPGTVTDEPNYAWMRAHSDFHAALASACTSPLLKQLRQQLFDAAELYRHWSVSLGASRSKREPSREHRQMMDASIAHDAELGVKLITEHIQRTTNHLLTAFQETGEPEDRPAERPGRS